MCSCEPLHTDEQKKDDKQEPIYNSCVDTGRPPREWWPIETVSKRGSGKSMQAARHDDDDDDDNFFVHSFGFSLWSFETKIHYFKIIIRTDEFLAFEFSATSILSPISGVICIYLQTPSTIGRMWHKTSF